MKAWFQDDSKRRANGKPRWRKFDTYEEASAAAERAAERAKAAGENVVDRFYIAYNGTTYSVQ